MLTVTHCFHQPLQVGSLPEGLLFLCFDTQRDREVSDYLPALEPGVLLSTLLGIDFGRYVQFSLPAGVVPSGVHWLRLSSRYRDRHIEAVLPESAEVRWYIPGTEEEWTSWHMSCS